MPRARDTSALWRGGLHRQNASRMRGLSPQIPLTQLSARASLDLRHPLRHKGRPVQRLRVGSYTGNPFFFANSFSETCGRAPMCWIISAAASAPSRPAFS